MKWEKPNGSTQYSADRKYAVTEAITDIFVAYELGSTTGIELGMAHTAEEARSICEDHEIQMVALRRRA